MPQSSPPPFPPFPFFLHPHHHYSVPFRSSLYLKAHGTHVVPLAWAWRGVIHGRMSSRSGTSSRKKTAFPSSSAIICPAPQLGVGLPVLPPFHARILSGLTMCQSVHSATAPVRSCVTLLCLGEIVVIVTHTPLTLMVLQPLLLQWALSLGRKRCGGGRSTPQSLILGTLTSWGSLY